MEEKIIVSATDHGTPEGFHNDGMWSGFGLEKYNALCERERKIAHRFMDIALTGDLPKLVKIALKKRSNEGDKGWKDEVQEVCRKVASLLAEGFHARIIIDMLRCATGGGCNYGYEFQRKFEAAKNKEVRKDFWGTEKRVSLVAAEDLLYDMLKRDVNIDEPTEEDIAKSYFYKEFVTDFLERRSKSKSA